jgi:hypothetical protein
MSTRPRITNDLPGPTGDLHLTYQDVFGGSVTLGKRVNKELVGAGS